MEREESEREKAEERKWSANDACGDTGYEKLNHSLHDT
jgi:hypothetical protein